MSGRRLVVIVAALSIVACSSPRKPTNELDPGSAEAALATCTGCHGDRANGNAAPPRSVNGETATTDPSVGAHQSHLTVSANSVRQPISCSECHVVPATIDAPGHIDKDVADLTWGPLARARGAVPTPAAGPVPAGTAITCTNYCHGATLGGGLLTSPNWTIVNRSQAGCGACHGIPPPPPHPVVSATATVCAQCHPDTIRPDGTINLGGGRHINGVIDLVGGTAGCTACHGDATRLPAENAPAPPRDARGNVATTAPGVGAHQRHLNGGSLRNGLACAECHVVPGTGPSGPDLTHVNGRADLTFAALAQTNGVTPTFDATNHTCTNYCHGASLSAGANRVTWNATGQALCGSCHGLPPASPHPAVTGGVTACGICHPGTVRSDGTIDTAGGKHINGSPDVVGTSCTACHGDASRGGVAGIAPPRDVAGNTATTAPGVGAHQAHLNAGPLSAPVACSECHTVPTDIAHAGQPLNLTWGTIATTGGAVPAYDAVAHTCTNYCHGSNGALQGGTLTTPNWTAGASQVACGSCHGLPPTTGRHVIPQHTGFSCSVCHGAAYTATSVDAARHVNGARDAGGADSALLTWVPETRTCTALCHGDPRVWAPVP